MFKETHAATYRQHSFNQLERDGWWKTVVYQSQIGSLKIQVLITVILPPSVTELLHSWLFCNQMSLCFPFGSDS